jgi:hypothetical protein
MRTLFVFVLLTAASTLIVKHEPVGSVEEATFLLTQIVIVPQSEFTVPKLKERFDEILLAQSGKARVLIVEAYCDKQAISKSIKYGTDVNYETWMNWYREYKIPTTAELLRIGPNAAMRVRDSAGNVASLVLSGSDPYTFQANGVEFHLLHVIASDSARLDDFKAPDLVSTLNFFMLAKGDLNESVLKAAAENLENSTGAPQITVAIRRDPWFVSSVYFPIVSPFWDGGKPPTQHEYESSPEWYCHATPGKAHCSRSM